MGTHASMLPELKEFISNKTAFVMRPYVALSRFLTSPPNMRGDLAIDHNVICKTKKKKKKKEDEVKIECLVISRVIEN